MPLRAADGLLASAPQSRDEHVAQRRRNRTADAAGLHRLGACSTSTFDEGMALVEETARYLDGKGREEARALPRKAAMLYAGESMRVTTRLMQAASWLLVQRAVRDGDMEARRRASATATAWAPRKSAWAHAPKTSRPLPAALQDLLERSDSLYRRIARLDDILFGEGDAPARRRARPDRSPGTGLRQRVRSDAP